MRLLLPFFSLILYLSACSPDPSLPGLSTEIEKEFSGLEGNFAVVFESLQDSTLSVYINADERFHAASTMKTPVMIELFKRADRGELTLQDSIPVTNTFKSIVDGSPFTMEVSEDSEKGLYAKLGQKEKLEELNYQMITRSSNLATNILIDFLGAGSVTRTMRDMGADSIEVLRGVEDIKAYRAGLSNSTTARDLAVMYREIGLNTLMSDSLNRKMIRVLKDQKYNDMIPAMLPEPAEVAHKTGWITGVHHDSGIVYMPGGKSFVMVILSKNAPDREAVLQAGAAATLQAYNFMNNE